MSAVTMPSPNRVASPASTISSDPRSPSSTSSSRGGRQRLLPWLEAQVNGGQYPGLQWIDPVRRIFKMAWKHSGRADWTDQHGLIFKAWAIHTGRYREGVDEPDWPLWKTRLRCAINKLKPDIMELKDMSCSEEPNPFRVFQFTNSRGSGPSSPPEDPSSASGSEEAEGFRFPIQDRPSVIQVHQGNIPTIVSESFDPKTSLDRQEDMVEREVSSLGSDLKQLSFTELVPNVNISLGDVSLPSGSLNSYEAMDTGSLKGLMGQPHHIKAENAENPDTAINDHEMLVTLRFRSEIMDQRTVTNPHGCRVFYGDLPRPDFWDHKVFGPMAAEQIAVPYTPGQLRSLQQDQYTQTLLKGLELGLSVFMHNKDIFLHRRCKTRIMTVVANKGERSTLKVGRNDPLKVFDFRDDFLQAFLQYQQGEGSRPSPQVVIAIGQDFYTDVDPYPNLFLSLTVTHPHASYLLSQHTADVTCPELSHSDQFDHHMSLLKDSHLTVPCSAIPTVSTEAALQADSSVF